MDCPTDYDQIKTPNGHYKYNIQCVDVHFTSTVAMNVGSLMFMRSCPNNISINSHKNTEDGMKRWLRDGPRRRLPKMAHSRWTILYNLSTIKNPKILCQRMFLTSNGCPLFIHTLDLCQGVTTTPTFKMLMDFSEFRHTLIL
ncbi:hypothetical protein NQ317_009724, partial [Molorchus minor]